MPPLSTIRFAPGWWALIGDRFIDETTDPEVLHYEPSDDDDDFADLDQEAVRESTTRIVNKRMQTVADFLNTYDYEGMSTPTTPDGSPIKKLKPEELVKMCGISSKIHKVVNWRDKWFHCETRFEQLVERFAEEIITGRLRYLLRLGYLPEEYSDCWEKMPWIVPKDPEFFLLGAEDFRKIHEDRKERSNKKEMLAAAERAGSSASSSSASSSSASGTSSSDQAASSSSSSGTSSDSVRSSSAASSSSSPSSSAPSSSAPSSSTPSSSSDSATPSSAPASGSSDSSSNSPV